MPDRDVAAEAEQGRLVEDLGNQPEILVRDDGGPVAHRDTGGFLTAVLKGVESEISHFGNIFTRRPDADDAAFVLWAQVLRIKVVCQSTVASGHVPLLVLVAATLGGCRREMIVSSTE